MKEIDRLKIEVSANFSVAIAEINKTDSAVARICVETAQAKAEELLNKVLALPAVNSDDKALISKLRTDIAILEREKHDLDVRAKALKSECTVLSGEFHQYKASQEGSVTKILELEREQTRSQDKLKRLEKENSRLSSVDSELKKLKKMNPAGLMNTVAKLKEKIAKNNELHKDALRKKTEEAEKYRKANKTVAEQIHLLVGKSITPKPIRSKQGYLFSVIEHQNAPTYVTNGLQFGVVGMIPSSDMGWHLQVESELGINIVVSVSELLRPFFPMSSELARVWPPELNAVIELAVTDYTRRNMPERVGFVNRVEQVILTSNEALSEQEQTALKRLKLITMLDFLDSREEATFKALLNFGMSQKEVDTLVSKVGNLYRELQKEYASYLKEKEKQKQVA